MDLSNTLLVTHQNCMDGAAAAVVFVRAGGKYKNIFFTTPDHKKTDELLLDLEQKNLPIIVVDASISLPLAEKFDRRAIDIRLLDHHTSAIELSKFSWCEIEEKNNRSGAKMFYDYMCKEGTGQQVYDLKPLEAFIDAADDVDRWVNKLPIAQDLIILFEFLQGELFVDRFAKRPTLLFSDREEYVISVSKHRRDTFIDRKKKEAIFLTKEVLGHVVKVAVVEAGTQQSMLGAVLCTDPVCGADIALIVNSKSISFRASPDCPVDLSKLAKLNGGGGHIKAAGSALSNILGKDFVELLMERIKLNE
jgi:uncharacterized protein